MKRTLKMLRPQLKQVAESLFPKTMYARRFHSWVKVEPELPLLPALCRKDAVALDIGANEGFLHTISCLMPGALWPLSHCRRCLRVYGKSMPARWKSMV